MRPGVAGRARAERAPQGSLSGLGVPIYPQEEGLLPNGWGGGIYLCSLENKFHSIINLLTPWLRFSLSPLPFRCSFIRKCPLCWFVTELVIVRDMKCE